ncbi:MAG TPA: ATP-dependent sacrificial sulfur transferase LarE [Chthoniobacterales bacterium]
MREKLTRLSEELRANAPLAIAYSGGVDSACLLALAHRELGAQALGVIADSPSLPRRALAEALAAAEGFGAKVEVVRTREFENPDYAANPLNRCYFCKAELFQRMDALARERGFRAIAYGENADDPAGSRPGSLAAREFRVLAPLKTAGLGKAEVRTLARELGLRAADAPSQPCLSSRVATGVPVTPPVLSQIEQAEEILRGRGFRILRVRFLEGGAARIQVGPEELARLFRTRAEVLAALEPVGFSRLELDPQGYRGVIA